jgi:hypothetical protein
MSMECGDVMHLGADLTVIMTMAHLSRPGLKPFL